MSYSMHVCSFAIHVLLYGLTICVDAQNGQVRQGDDAEEQVDGSQSKIYWTVEIRAR